MRKMMQQFYFTYCAVNMSFNGKGGWQIRAMSPGLSEATVRPFLSVADYQKPYARISLAEAPLRLAFLPVKGQTGDTQRVLIHSVFIGTEAGRLQDNFFSHVLVDMSDSIGAVDAIRTWRSASWMADNYEGSITLPELAVLPINLSLSSEGIQKFLKDRSLFKILAGCIQACMPILLESAQSQCRIFIADDSESIARIIHGIAICLPIALQRKMTFSTYERNPLDVQATIVGTFFANQQGQSLPAQCHTGGNFSVDLFNHETFLPEPEEFAQRVVSLFEKGDSGTINFLLKSLDEIGYENASDLNFLTHVMPLVNDLGRLGVDEVCTVLSLPKIAEHSCLHDKRQTLAARAVDLAVSDNSTFRMRLKVVIQKLAGSAGTQNTVRALREQAMCRARQEVRNGSNTLVSFLVSDFLCWCGELDIMRNWAGLVQAYLDKPSDYSDLSVSTKVFLLEKVADCDWGNARPNFDKLLQKWLDIGVDQLDLVLRSQLPSTFKAAAITSCLSRENVSEFPALIRNFLSEKSAVTSLRYVLMNAVAHPRGYFISDLLNLSYRNGVCLDFFNSEVAQLRIIPKINGEKLIAAFDFLQLPPSDVAGVIERLIDSAYCLHENFKGALPSSVTGKLIARFVRQVKVGKRCRNNYAPVLSALLKWPATLIDEDLQRVNDLLAVQDLLCSEVSAQFDYHSFREVWFRLADHHTSEMDQDIIQVLARTATPLNWGIIFQEFGDCMCPSPKAFLENISQSIVSVSILNVLLVVEIIKTSLDIPSSDIELGLGIFVPAAICGYLNKDKEVFCKAFWLLLNDGPQNSKAIALFRVCDRINSAGSENRLLEIAEEHPELPGALLDALLDSLSQREQAGGFLDRNVEFMLGLHNLNESELIKTFFQRKVESFPLDVVQIRKSFDILARLQKSLNSVILDETRNRLTHLLCLGSFVNTRQISDVDEFSKTLHYFSGSIDPFLKSLPRAESVGVECSKMLLRMALTESNGTNAGIVEGIFEKTGRRILALCERPTLATLWQATFSGWGLNSANVGLKKKWQQWTLKADDKPPVQFSSLQRGASRLQLTHTQLINSRRSTQVKKVNSSRRMLLWSVSVFLVFSVIVVLLVVKIYSKSSDSKKSQTKEVLPPLYELHPLK